MPKSYSNSNNKEQQIFELTQELHNLQKKRKAIAGAFTERIKSVKKDISDLLEGEPTNEEVIENVEDVHDLELVD